MMMMTHPLSYPTLRPVEEFMCGAFNTSGPGEYGASRFTAGSTGKALYQFDLLTGLTLNTKVEVPCGKRCMMIIIMMVVMMMVIVVVVVILLLIIV